MIIWEVIKILSLTLGQSLVFMSKPRLSIIVVFFSVINYVIQNIARRFYIVPHKLCKASAEYCTVSAKWTLKEIHKHWHKMFGTKRLAEMLRWTCLCMCIAWHTCIVSFYHVNYVIFGTEFFRVYDIIRV